VIMKSLIVMRGVPGSGKSTFVSKLVGYTVVSADYYFDVMGNKFDISRLGDAHKLCMKQFLNAIMGGENVVVDNTNINLEDIAPYVAVGPAMDYQIEIDPAIAASRNVHGVPGNTVSSMHKRLSFIKLPKRWNVRRVPAEMPGE
jgi:predicted kinase